MVQWQDTEQADKTFKQMLVKRSSILRNELTLVIIEEAQKICVL